MRAEISSLREMVGNRQADPARESAGGNSAVQQRLAERLQEFGLGAELANNLSRRHRAGRLEDGWKQSLKMLATGVRTGREDWLDAGGVSMRWSGQPGRVKPPPLASWRPVRT